MKIGVGFRALCLSLVFVACLSSFVRAQSALEVYAITNAKIVTVSGKPIEKGTIVLRDGLIAAVGEKVTPPADARVMDGTGLILYPGMVDGFSNIGMPAAADYPAARGDVYPVPKVRADNAATALYKPDAAASEARRKAGFGAMLIAPNVGLFTGTSAAFSTGTASDPSALVLKPIVASHIDSNASDPERGYPNSRMGEIAAVRQALYDALDADARLKAYERDPKGQPRPAVSRAIAALRPVIQGKLPLVIYADSAADMRRALHLCREFKLRPVIEGGREAYRIADELKEADATVLLSVTLPEPPKLKKGEEDPTTLEGYRYRAMLPRTAGMLAKAGVPFAFTTEGLANIYDYSRNIRRFIAAGLPEDKAIEAATLSPARIIGIDRQVGAIETGKIANIVAVSGGTLFDPKAKLKYVFVDGKQVEVDAARPAATAKTGGAIPANIPLPPGVTKEQALEFLKTDPNAAKPFLPAGVTVEQAIAALEGKTPEAPKEAKEPEAKMPDAPPIVTAGPLMPLPPAVPKAFVLRGATVWTVGPQGTLPNADVYVKDGKIAGVGENLKVPAGTMEINAKGKHISPGMIDCHSHTAISGGVNEGTNIVTAECRIEDVIDADDVNIYRQLAGGTTAANLLHGSANAIGGQNAVVKWRWGKSPEEMLLKGAPAGIKFALGENPKQSNFQIPGREPRYPNTRMGVEKVIRESFLKARDYQRQWAEFRAGKAAFPPRRNLQLDALAEILEGKRYVHSHCYRQDEILMLMRVAEDFGFHIRTLQHVLEGYKVADEMAKHGAGGSTFSDWWAFKIEAYDAIPYNGALMTNRGVVVSFNSDSSELARRLNLEAAKAVHYGGISPEEAIKFDTINPAKQLGIDKMTGSLEVGKDADLVVWSGSPLSSLGVCEKTFVDGQLYFDRAADIAARPALIAEKERLAKAERKDEKEVEGRRQEAGVDTPATPYPISNIQHSVPFPGNDAPLVALVGGTVHPVSGPAIPNGIVLMEGGKIKAVGAEIPIPAGATRQDVTGLHVYPGMIDADTELGLTEIESIRATNDASELGAFNPELRANVAINPDSELIPVARRGGVLNVVTAPNGGTLSGMGAVICLSGWTWEDMTIDPTAGLYLNFPAMGQRRFRETAHRCEETAGSPDDEIAHDPSFRSGEFVPAGSYDTDALRFGLLPNTGFGGQPPARRRGSAAAAAPGADADEEEKTALKPLNDFFDTARRYRDARRAEGKDGVPAHDRDPKMEAMLPVLEGKIPVAVRADREKDIRSAVAWAKGQGIRITLIGGQEADQCADLLAKNQIPVILGPTLNLPRKWDAPYDDAFTIPAKLAKAGVPFCLSTGDASNVRRLPNHAAMAAAYGLPQDEALKAITLYPAQILGIADRLGSLEPDKQADIIVTNGDVLENMTEVKAAFIAGKPIDLTNKQTRLYDKYKARPKK